MKVTTRPVWQLLKRTLAKGALTYNEYDAAGRRTSTTMPRTGWSAPATRRAISLSYLEYGSNGQQTLSADPLGYHTYFEYDALNRMHKVTDARGAASETVYDAVGRVTATVNPHTYVGRLRYYWRPDPVMYLLGVRMYDQRLGRFVRRDPLREPEEEYWQRMGYAYARSAPPRLVHPCGLGPETNDTAVSTALLRSVPDAHEPGLNCGDNDPIVWEAIQVACRAFKLRAAAICALHTCCLSEMVFACMRYWCLKPAYTCALPRKDVVCREKSACAHAPCDKNGRPLWGWDFTWCPNSFRPGHYCSGPWRRVSNVFHELAHICGECSDRLAERMAKCLLGCLARS